MWFPLINMPILATFFIQTCLTTKFSKFFVQILLEIKRREVHSISGAKRISKIAWKLEILCTYFSDNREMHSFNLWPPVETGAYGERRVPSFTTSRPSCLYKNNSTSLGIMTALFFQNSKSIIDFSRVQYVILKRSRSCIKLHRLFFKFPNQ